MFKLKLTVQSLEKRVVALEAQLQKTLIVSKRPDNAHQYINWYFGEVLEDVHEATLKGKVEAILEHLKLNIDVQQEQSTPAKVTAAKVIVKKDKK